MPRANAQRANAVPLPRRRVHQARRRGSGNRGKPLLAAAGGVALLSLAFLVGGRPSSSAPAGAATQPSATVAAASLARAPTPSPRATEQPEAAAAAPRIVATSEPEPPAPSLPPCTHDDLPASVDPAAPHLTLVDTALAVPPEHAPRTLVPISEAGLAGRGSIAAEALPDLTALVSAAKDANLALIGVSGYRSYDDQARMFSIWESRLGRESALRSSARAGHSEHQLGYALDFSTRGTVDPWRLRDWGTTAEGAWMAENAWRFGWVMSYPPDRSEVTCYRYESWHYRWVGRDVAAALEESGLTLRELLWQRQHGAGDARP